MAKSIVLQCASCVLPWARIENDVLIVESRHHGAIHVNVIPIQELVRIVEEDTPGPQWPPEMETKTGT